MGRSVFFFFQAEDGIRDLVRSRGLGDVYKRQVPELGSGEQAELVTQQPSRRVVEIHTTSLPARSSAARASLRPVDGATNCRGGVDRPA